MTPAQRARFEAVLPFYVNGSADVQDRAFVDALLDDAEARDMLTWHEGLARKVRSQVDSVGDDIGLAALMRKVYVHRSAAAAPRPALGQAWWTSLKGCLSQGRRLQVPALAVLALVVVGQGILLHRLGDGLADDGELGAIRGVAPAAELIDKGAVLKVNFKDDTSEHDLRMLLIATGANIVQGPGQLGDYLVSVPSNRANAALQELKTSKWVNAVALVTLTSSKP